MTFLLVALLLASSPGAPPPRPTSLDEALAQTIAAYGGVPALSKVKVLRQTARVVSTMRGGQTGAVLRVLARPQQLRVEVAYPGQAPEVRVLDGRRGWRDGVPALGGDLKHTAMVLQALRLQLPLLLQEHRDRLIDGGLVQRDGRILRAIVLPVEAGLFLTAEVDPASGRIVRAVGQAEVGRPGLLEFATAYDDYRTVGGVLFPFKEVNFAMGQHTGDTVIDSVELLPQAPPGSFAP